LGQPLRCSTLLQVKSLSYYLTFDLWNSFMLHQTSQVWTKIYQKLDLMHKMQNLGVALRITI
jgi:hypothetical protein